MKGFNITGEISKREVGLISLVIITTAGATLAIRDDKILAVAFFGVASICIMVFILIHVIEYYRKISMDDRLLNLYKMEIGWGAFELDGKLDNINTFKIYEYESAYFKAIAENKLQLAEAFKNKIEELKKDDCHQSNKKMNDD